MLTPRIWVIYHDIGEGWFYDVASKSASTRSPMYNLYDYRDEALEAAYGTYEQLGGRDPKPYVNIFIGLQGYVDAQIERDKRKKED